MEQVVKTERFEGSYFQWIKEELTGWDRLPWVLYIFGVAIQSVNFALNPITWQAAVAFVGSLFGMLCTVAMCAGGYRTLSDGRKVRVTSHSINGLLGAISVVAFIIVNFTFGHYWSIFDQLVFLSFIDIPLMMTWRTWGRGSDGAIKQLSTKGYIFAGLAVLVGWGVFYFVGGFLGDQQLFWDSLTLAFGAVASWLCFRRYSLTYKIWILTNLINIALFVETGLKLGFGQGSLAMILNYSFYILTCLVGLHNWKPTKK